MAKRPAKQTAKRGIVPNTVAVALDHVHAQGAGAKALDKGRIVLTGGRGEQRKKVAEGVAAALGKGMFSLDLSGPKSKYIGETEKGIEAVFHLAEGTKSVLYFDEAEALFGKRSEVKDAHDRFADIGVAFLRRRINAYRGLLILATDDTGGIDHDLMRRLGAVVPLLGVRKRKES